MTFNNNKGFTLAEVMIVLTVIGIISAIIMPIAFQSVPDENVLKFKKANSTLYQAIQELVNSDKYYKDGDLGIKADGTQLNTTTDEIYKNNWQYFCNTLVDVLSTKSFNCDKSFNNGCDATIALFMTSYTDDDKLANTEPFVKHKVTDESVNFVKNYLDYRCKVAATTMGDQIVLTDGTVFFESKAGVAFGTKREGGYRYLSAPNSKPTFPDEFGMDTAYKAFCIDVDGVPSNATTSNCVNECPFGYGIRADGKILTGQRADEWLKKDIQGEN